MILKDVYNLDLYVEDEFGNRIELNRELNVNESAFVGNTRNKIKRISEDEYMFLRFEGVDTHICDVDVDYNIKDIVENVHNQLAYNLKYASDRVEFLNNLLEYNRWIYDLFSTKRIIKKEIKNKKSLLAKDQTLDSEIEKLANYLIYPKFKDEQDEVKYQKLIEEQQVVERKKNRHKTKEDYDTLNKLINEIESYKVKVKIRPITRQNNTELSADLSKRETFGDFIYQEEIQDRVKKIRKGYKKRDIPDDYWEKFYSKERKNLIPFYDTEENVKSIPAIEFRKECLRQIKKATEELRDYLGLNIKDKKKREEYENKLKTRIGIREYNIIRDMYNKLKADYEEAKKLLTDELTVNSDKQSTVYNIDFDTYYYDENGNLVEVSRNLVSLGYPETYRGLILTYRELKDKYKDKHDSSIWALIMDFENILSKTEFTKEEQFVLDVLFDGYNQTQIRLMYENENLERITKNRISRMINDTIPNKLLNTYLDMVQDWLVVNWQIGKYKVCSKCGEPKLANERYFRPDPLAKDNLRSQCRKCEVLAK